MFYFIGIGQNVDIYYLPLKTALEAVGDEKFFKANFNPIYISQIGSSWAELNVVHVYKKTGPKSKFFAPKIALRVERSDPARNHKFCDNFLNAPLQCG
jgi:hypothetical protein